MKEATDESVDEEVQSAEPARADTRLVHPGREPFSLAYNINIELPAVRDQAVYDAIFKSLRDNLL